MKKESAEAVQWLIDFVNLDLENIKPGDKAKLIIEAEENLWPNQEMREFQASSPVPLSEKQLGHMAWALKMPPQNSPENWAMILHSHLVVREFFLRYLIPSVHPSPRSLTKPPEKPAPSQVMSGHDEMLWWVGWGHNFPLTIKTFYITESPDDYLRLKIIRLLQGLPVPGHTIKVCPGCERFFLNPTARKKEFCSARCMSKILTRRRREADREGYRKYQSVLMKDLRREEKNLPRKKTKAREKECPKCNRKFLASYWIKGIRKKRKRCPHCGFAIEAKKDFAKSSTLR